MKDIQGRIDGAIESQEKRYFATVLDFVQVKERELNALLQALRDKSLSISAKDEEIIELKKMLVLMRQELYEADN